MIPSYKPINNPKLGDILLQAVLAGIPLLFSIVLILFDVVNNISIKLLVIALFVCTAVLLVNRVKTELKLFRLGKIIFIAAFFIWYSYPALINIILPNYQIDPEIYRFVDEETVLWSIIYLSLFLFSGVIASLQYLSPGKSHIERVNTEVSPSAKAVTLFALSGCLLGLLPYLFLGSSISEVMDGIFQSRSVEKLWLQSFNLGDAVSPFTFTASSATVAGALLLWLVTIDSRVPFYWRILVGITAIFFTTIIYFDQGTRSITFLIAIPPVAIKIVKAWRYSRAQSLFLFLIFSSIIIVILQFQLFYRSSYTRWNLSKIVFGNLFLLGGTIDFFKETLLAVKLIPSYHDYFRESILLQFITSPIPRFIWPEKPVSELVWFFTQFRWNIDIFSQPGNLLPGIVGQFYMSWGWVGPPTIGAIFGLILKRIDIFLSRIEIESDPYGFAIGILWASWIFISFRMLSPGFFYPVLASALAIFLCKSVFPKKRKIAHWANTKVVRYKKR